MARPREELRQAGQRLPAGGGFDLQQHQPAGRQPGTRLSTPIARSGACRRRRRPAPEAARGGLPAAPLAARWGYRAGWRRSGRRDLPALAAGPPGAMPPVRLRRAARRCAAPGAKPPKRYRTPSRRRSGLSLASVTAIQPEPVPTSAARKRPGWASNQASASSTSSSVSGRGMSTAGVMAKSSPKNSQRPRM